MFGRLNLYGRWIVICLLVISGLIETSSRPRDFTLSRGGISSHDISDEHRKEGLTREQLSQEAWVWHRANKQRLAETHPLGEQALTTQIINNDINDISVIQGDSRLVTNANLFDLVGFEIRFTPSGNGYTISAAAAPFDTNLGTKLDLTTAPAVNPKAQADPGDDGFIPQDIGFSFPFFGTNYTSVGVSSNGNLVFNPGNVSTSTFNNGAVSSIATLSEFQLGLPRIAPYWHDLDAQASQVTGSRGVYIRKEANRVLVTWNDIRDFPNDSSVDNGVHRFQVSLFNDGRIAFSYNLVQLTSQGLAGISPGGTQNTPSLVNLLSPPAGAISNPMAEFFSTATRVDYIGAIEAFYSTHPGQSNIYDFIYFMTDFDFDLGGGAFAFFQGIRNSIGGIGQGAFDDDPGGTLGSTKVQGILNLSNLVGDYPESPVTRFLGANHALSIFGQEQGHRWMSFVRYPGNSLLLLGRDNAHWSYFMNIESTISSPAARRSSSMEGNVWVENNGTFTSVNLIDGFSRLDQYLMGLRPPTDVPDTFVIANPFNTSLTRSSSPRPNSVISGTRQNVTINQIIQANGARTPDSNAAPKHFRAAVILLVREGTQPSQARLNKITRYRLAWESYFAQSTDFIGTIDTALASIGLAEQSVSRAIAAASAASFNQTLAPGEIAALFGSGLTAGATQVATSQPLPTTLAGTQVLINGVAAPLFFVSPTQINFQVPRTTSSTTIVPAVQSSTALVEVISNGALIRAGSFQIAPSVPALFTTNQSGTGGVAALDAFTNAPGPFNARQANGQPNIIAVFGTGLGADVTDVDGDVKATVQATIGGNAMTVSYAGRAPGFTGLNQFNLTFPANLSPGTYDLIVSRNGIPGRTVTVTVK